MIKLNMSTNILFCRIIEEARTRNPDLPPLDTSAFGPPAHLYATNKSSTGAGENEATTAPRSPASLDKPLERTSKRETLVFLIYERTEACAQVSSLRKCSRT